VAYVYNIVAAWRRGSVAAAHESGMAKNNIESGSESVRRIISVSWRINGIRKHGIISISEAAAIESGTTHRQCGRSHQWR